MEDFFETRIPSRRRTYRSAEVELFSKKYRKRITAGFEVDASRRDGMRLWQEELKHIFGGFDFRSKGERQFHEQFFTDVFEKTLGYRKRRSGNVKWTLDSEVSTDTDASRPDGILGFFVREGVDDVRVVIELKSPGVDLDLRQHGRKDKHTPIEQAFNYAHKFSNVEWVIVSNYNEVRLYPRQSSKYSINFDLTKIVDKEEDLQLFILLLSEGSLFVDSGESQTARLFREREEQLKYITTEFYDEYKRVRYDTASHILYKHGDDGIGVEQAVILSQTILDRILFIAFLEAYNLLQTKAIEGAYSSHNPYNPTRRWDNFINLFKYMDVGNSELGIPPYNGGLFRANPEIERLDIDLHVLEGYNRLAGYDFASDLHVKILGHVFEKSITDLDSLKASLRGDISVDTRRHDEGAYYTPEVVTDYVIEHSIGIYLRELRDELGIDNLPDLREKWQEWVAKQKDQKEDKTISKKKHDAEALKRSHFPEWLSDKSIYDRNDCVGRHIEFWKAYSERLQSIKIVDPSCGSGAFLVSAFAYLMREGERINSELNKLHEDDLFKNWDREVLRNNLFGVDISEEAVEITKLALWLLIAKHKEKLVTLDEHIVKEDAVAGKDWSKLFPDVMAEGGFDIVIGNPPYLRQELIDSKPVLEERFEVYAGRADLYVYFYELGYNILKQGGFLGYITSNKWMRTQYGKKLRKFIKDKASINCLIDLADRPLFEDATTYTNILTFRKQAPSSDNRMIILQPPFFEDEATSLQSELSEDGYHLQKDPLFHAIWKKMHDTGTPLEEWEIETIRGIGGGLNEAFIISTKTKEQLIKQDSKSMEIIKPLLRGEDVQRWHADWQEQWIILARRGIDIETYPAIKKHLSIHKDKLLNRSGSQKWYELQRESAAGNFEQEKIIYPDIADKSIFSLDKNNYYINNVVHSISGDNLPYLSAILNSDLLYWYILNASPNIRGSFARFNVFVIKSIPIPQLSKAKQKPFIELSEQLHDLTQKHYQIANSFTELLQAEFNIAKLGTNLKKWHSRDLNSFFKALENKKIKLRTKQKDEWQELFSYKQKEIKKLNEQITQAEQKLNDLVYKLYNLNQEEINFIKVNF